MADDPELGDDVGWWDCSLCTYKNSADKFKCEICDLRRGTSTRKPRCNADTIVAQVVKQQEQIRQQTRAKPAIPKSGRTSTSGISNNHAPTTSSDGSSKTKRPSRPGGPRDMSPDEDEEGEDIDDLDSDFEDAESKPKKRKSSQNAKRKSRISKGTKNDASGSDSDESDATDRLSHSSRSLRIGERSLSVSPATTIFSSSSTSPERTVSSPNHNEHSINSTTKTGELDKSQSKSTPIEIKGNLIKYAPPTSTGRTGLIIDKKRFTQHSVTVNDVTITFTEFATRQNNYIRKKKKRRDHSRSRPQATSTDSNDNNNNNNLEGSVGTTSSGSGKSRPSTKSEPKLSSSNGNGTTNSTTATVAGDL